MIKASLLAAEKREAKLDRLGDVLQVMEKHIDFKALAAEIDQAAPRPGRERGGRPPFPTELMVRALILQESPFRIGTMPGGEGIRSLPGQRLGVV